jgi:hypothetical protein
MIDNEYQYNLAKAQASRFEQTLAQLAAQPENASQSSSIHPLLRKAERDALQSQLETLREEMAEYEALR